MYEIQKKRVCEQVGSVCKICVSGMDVKHKSQRTMSLGRPGEERGEDLAGHLSAACSGVPHL